MFHIHTVWALRSLQWNGLLWLNTVIQTNLLTLKHPYECYDMVIADALPDQERSVYQQCLLFIIRSVEMINIKGQIAAHTSLKTEPQSVSSQSDKLNSGEELGRAAPLHTEVAQKKMMSELQQVFCRHHLTCTCTSKCVCHESNQAGVLNKELI